MKTALTALALLPLALAGCTTTMPDGGDGTPVRAGVDTCDSDPAQRYVGQRATQEVGAAVLAATDARELRWLPPGTIVTMEYRYGRVSIAYDEQSIIERISCG
ncbi:hypothetical protein GRI62_10475 [Erythrobacter arachoides]|uniref:Peptidase inhibitor I78 n=1 Tax=Aurantiacibacter arachoides TaxID=1850444 RepID=A0A845A1L2_9SPHN|nr:I78 family peptidase inhibitor [Aurantiacibacter arachoides]MXO94025.1 hypothetical protein [Aurantiacibacter arachoides]GGD44668.1 hypothetical protein GCM10011411_00410 [Aurantiacibacter arachoides]